MHINFLGPVAHGNAIEEGWAEVFHIPAIYCMPEAMRLSRLPKGMINVEELVWYGDLEDAYQRLVDIFGEIDDWLEKHESEKPLGFFAERGLARGPRKAR